MAEETITGIIDPVSFSGGEGSRKGITGYFLNLNPKLEEIEGNNDFTFTADIINHPGSEKELSNFFRTGPRPGKGILIHTNRKELNISCIGEPMYISGYSLENNKEYNIITTYNSKEGKLTFWVNGEIVNQQNAVFNIEQQKIEISGWQSTTAPRNQNILKNCMIFSRTLSDEECIKISEGKQASFKFDKHLIAYWKLRSDLLDYSGRNQTLTAMNDARVINKVKPVEDFFIDARTTNRDTFLLTTINNKVLGAVIQAYI